MVSLDNTLGAQFIGVIVASILYGLTCLQTWYYYVTYPLDPWYLKFLVFCTLASDTVHQILITHLIYRYTITYFGQFEELTKIVWSLIVEVYFNGFTALVVQLFLTWRIYRLSNRNWIIVGIALILVFGEFILILMYNARGIHYDTYVQLATLKGISKAVNIVAAAGDLYIAVMLCYLLHRSRTGFERSDTMITKLVVFSINTGLLTSICALCSLISISVWPHTLIYIAFYFNIGRLYCNSLLATLNARKSIRDCQEDDMSLSLRSYAGRKTNTTMVGTSSRHVPNNISIKIDTVHEHHSQDEYSASGDVKNPEVV